MQNSDAYIGSPFQFVREQHRVFHHRLDALDEERDHSFLFEMRDAGMTDYAALPLVFGSGTLNVLSAATASPQGFDDGDLDRLAALANLLAPLVEIIEARRMTLGLLDAFVGPRSASASCTARSSAATATTSMPRTGTPTCAASPPSPNRCRPRNCCTS